MYIFPEHEIKLPPTPQTLVQTCHGLLPLPTSENVKQGQ
jgi:hypothetical protein